MQSASTESNNTQDAMRIAMSSELELVQINVLRKYLSRSDTPGAAVLYVCVRSYIPP